MPRSGLVALDGRHGPLRGACPGAGPQGRVDQVPLAACRRRLRRKRQSASTASVVRCPTRSNSRPRRSGRRFPRRSFTAAGSIDRQQLLLGRFDGTTLDGRLSGSGRLSWDGDKPWRAQLDGRSLDLAKLRPDLSGRVDVIGEIEGRGFEADGPVDCARHEAVRLAVRTSTHRQRRDRLPQRHLRTEAHPGGERRIARRHRRALGPERGPALEREPEVARPHRSRRCRANSFPRGARAARRLVPTSRPRRACATFATAA